MSLAITVEPAGLQGLNERIRRLAAGLGDSEPLLQSLAAEIESQTRRRIADEQAAPDGTPWPAWSDAYARSRHGGQSLLQSEGSLLDSIMSAVSGGTAETGSNLVYAALQQFGGEQGMAPGPAAVPAREFLGVSEQDGQELQAIVDEWLSGQIAGAVG